MDKSECKDCASSVASEIFEEKMKYLHESVEKGFTTVNSRLDKLNGQVGKNSEFRIQGKVIGGGALIILAPLITIILNKIF